MSDQSKCTCPTVHLSTGLTLPMARDPQCPVHGDPLIKKIEAKEEHAGPRPSLVYVNMLEKLASTLLEARRAVYRLKDSLGVECADNQGKIQKPYWDQWASIMVSAQALSATAKSLVEEIEKARDYP